MESINNIVWRVLKTRPFEPIRPKILRSNVYLLKGKIQSNLDLSVVILGSKESREYFSNLIFVDKPKIEFLGKQTQNNLASLTKTVNGNFVIVEANWLSTRFFLNNAFFVSPRIDFVLNIARSMETIQNGFSESKKRGMKKAAKAGYTYEITKDPAKIESVFNDIYLPHMVKRHGKSALPVSFAEFKRLSSEGDLLLTKLGQECVCGALLVRNGDELHAPVFAIKEVDRKLALGSYALYYSCINLGIQRGFARLDFGETPPFIKDGGFQYKKSFGMQIRPAQGPNAQVFGIRFSNMSGPVRDFLEKNPFVFVDENSLSGLVFLESFKDFSDSFCIPGLSSLYIISSDLDCANMPSFNLRRISLDNYSGETTSALKLLIKMCNEEGYYVYRMFFQK